MILALLTILIPALFGISLVAKYTLVKEKVTAAALGTIGGLALTITITYLVDLALPITPLLIGIILAALTGIMATTIQQGAWRNWKKMKIDNTALVLAVALILFSLAVGSKILINKPDGIYTGVLNAYGDAPWHVANVTGFAENQTTPPENPIFAGSRLTYPFLADYFSAMLLIGGASLALSINLPAIILIPVTFLMLYAFAKRYAKESRIAAIITVILVLFGGATFGWINFTQDLSASDTSLIDFITHLSGPDYSGNTDVGGFNFLNSISALLLPQRSFLFGMPLAFSILLLLHPPKKKQKRTPENHKKEATGFITAGVLAGILPLFHAHTVLALIPAILGLMILIPTTSWMLFLLTAAAIGFPEVFYYSLSDTSSQSFFRIESGWMSGNSSLIWYWFKNTGFLIPAAVAGLFIKKSPKPLKVITIAGLVLFIASNTLAFAPWIWDNMKILIFWLIFTSPMIGYTAAHLIKQKKIPYITAFIAAFILLHTASAGIDMWKLVLPTSPTWQEWDTSGIAIADSIRTKTSPQDSIISAPFHNSPVTLTGRAMYMGFPGHIWSHGGTYQIREKAIKDFFAGAITTLPENMPSYALIGPVERQQFPNLKIQPNWEIVDQAGTYTLYKIR